MNVFILAIIVFFIYGTLSDWLLRKKFKIEKARSGFYKSVNRLHSWINGTLLILFFIGCWFVEDNYLLFLCFIFVLFCIRVYMEWKYENSKKEHIMTLNSIFSLFLFLGLVYFFV
jgi:Flp pilus assembly protein TadB